MPKKERTPEEQAERKEKHLAKRTLKRDSLLTILNFVRGRKNVPDEVKIAAKVITPGIRVGRGGGPSKLTVFSAFFKENDETTELEIFNKFKMGRAEMRKVMVSMIKKNKPNERIWARLDAEVEHYVVEGYGANAPANWTGYRPVEVEDTEIV